MRLAQRRDQGPRIRMCSVCHMISDSSRGLLWNKEQLPVVQGYGYLLMFSSHTSLSKFEKRSLTVPKINNFS